MPWLIRPHPPSFAPAPSSHQPPLSSSGGGAPAATEAFSSPPPLHFFTPVQYAATGAVLPLLLLHSSPASVLRAACAHLIITPITAPDLQLFAMEGGALTSWLCRAALFMGSLAALLLLLVMHTPARCAAAAATLPSSSAAAHRGNNNATSLDAIAQPVAHGLVASSLCLGCVQLLFMVRKENVLRVMGCTAAGVVVAALAVAAAFGPVPMARRFLQAAILPFLVLFAEASRRGARPSSSRVLGDQQLL